MPAHGKRGSYPSLSSIIELSRSGLPVLQEKYRVREIGNVGSYARGEQTDESDPDPVIDFSEPIGWDVADLKEYLKRPPLSLPVDLNLKGVVLMRPRLFEAITRDILSVTA